MLTFHEALARVLALAPRPGTEVVALEAALGRVLAEAVHARAPLPPHDYSAMDGYALDTRTLGGDPPWDLPVRGESRTGRSAPALEPGALCRIFTGAPVPNGADAIVMQENVEHRGALARLSTRPQRGEHLRRAGDDLADGAVALEAGARLGAYQLGLAAAVDRGELVVARRPRVTILSTGDELRKPGSAARAASIPESNSVVIAALATTAGATVRVAEPCSDDLEETRREIGAALDSSDLVVTIGGVSVGDYDVVRPALEALGVHLDFYKVAIKPGKPLTLGRRGDTLVLGLPGNPVSAQVTFTLFGLPLLRRMQGDRRELSPTRTLRLGAALAQKPGRRGYYAATVEGDVATPLGGQSSGSTVSLAHADALIVVPEQSAGYASGDAAEVLMLGSP
jgi:molybdopterin molybdotransferase